MSSADKVREELLAVRVVDWKAQKVTVLDEIGLRAVGAHVHLVRDVVIGQEGPVMGVLLRSQIEEREDPCRPDIGGG